MSESWGYRANVRLFVPATSLVLRLRHTNIYKKSASIIKAKVPASVTQEESDNNDKNIPDNNVIDWHRAQTLRDFFVVAVYSNSMCHKETTAVAKGERIRMKN